MRTLPTFSVSAGGLRSLSPVEDGAGRLFTVSAGPAGTLSVSAVVSASGVSLWNWTTASVGAAGLNSTPAFADASAILFVSTGVGVSALNVATGTLVGPAYTPPAGCSVVGDPTANAFGGAFAVQIGCVSAGIVSLSPAGSLVWTASFNALVSAVAGFAPAVSIKGDVVVVCATSAGSGPGLRDGVLVAANATSGAPLWTAPSPLQGGCAAPPMFTADPADVFVFQAGGSANSLGTSAVYAYNALSGAAGPALYSVGLQLASAPVSGPAASGLLFVVDAAPGASTLIAGSAEAGGTAWELALDAGSPAVPSLAVGAADAAGNFTVFVTSGPASVLGVDGTTGEPRWGPVGTGGGAVAGLAVAADSSLLVALSAGGVLVLQQPSTTASLTPFATQSSTRTPSTSISESRSQTKSTTQTRSQTKSFSVTSTATAPSLPWGALGGNPQHTGGGVFDGPRVGPAAVAWTAARVSGAPLLVPRSADRVYAFCDGGGALCSVSAANGDVALLAAAGPVASGIYPALGGVGDVIYAQSAGANGSQLLVLYSNGTSAVESPVLLRPPSVAANGSRSGGPASGLTVNPTAYEPSISIFAPCTGVPGKPTDSLCAFVSTGALRWSLTPPPGPLTPAAAAFPTCAVVLDSQAQFIYAAASNGALSRFTASGKLSQDWPVAVTAASPSGAADYLHVAIGNGGVILIVDASAPGPDAAALLVAVDQGGVQGVLWRLRLNSSAVRPVTPPPSGNVVFFDAAAAPGSAVAAGGALVEVDVTTGAVLRRVAVPWLPVTGTVLDLYGTLYVGGSDQSLHAFRHDLSPAWDLPVGGDLSGASLVLGPGGALYVTVAGRGLVKVVSAPAPLPVPPATDANPSPTPPNVPVAASVSFVLVSLCLLGLGLLWTNRGALGCASRAGGGSGGGGAGAPEWGRSLGSEFASADSKLLGGRGGGGYGTA